MAEKIIDDVQLDFRAYQKFRREVNRGNYKKAYEAFEERPNLVEYLKINEIPIHYCEIRERLGLKQAVKFSVAVEFEIKGLEKLLKDGYNVHRILREFGKIKCKKT